MGISQPCRVVDVGAQPVEGRKVSRFGHFARRRRVSAKGACFDEKSNLKNADMTDESNSVAFFVETASRIGEVQGQGRLPTSMVRMSDFTC